MIRDYAKQCLNGGGPFDMGGKRIARRLVDHLKGGSE